MRVFELVECRHALDEQLRRVRVARRHEDTPKEVGVLVRPGLLVHHIASGVRVREERYSERRGPRILDASGEAHERKVEWQRLRGERLDEVDDSGRPRGQLRLLDRGRSRKEERRLRARARLMGSEPRAPTRRYVLRVSESGLSIFQTEVVASPSVVSEKRCPETTTGVPAFVCTATSWVIMSNALSSGPAGSKTRGRIDPLDE